MRVTVLHGHVPPDAPPDEQDVLHEAAAVLAALQGLGHDACTLPLTLDLAAGAAALQAQRPDVVFNLVESLAGMGRLIHLAPALLDGLKLRYTGASTEAIFLTSNKLLAKRWLLAHDIDTPAWLAAGDLAAGAPAFPGPYIVKSVWEHASIGLDEDSVVSCPDALAATLARKARTLGGEWFAEAFIAGREFNLALLAGPSGPVVLPAAEMTFPGFEADRPRIVGYRAKWHEDTFEYRHTQRTFDFASADAPLIARLEQVARRCWAAFGLRGYARVDFRVDAAGRPWVLEVNVNPCIAPDSGFVAAAARAGLTPEDAVARILADVPPAPPTPGPSPAH